MGPRQEDTSAKERWKESLSWIPGPPCTYAEQKLFPVQLNWRPIRVSGTPKRVITANGEVQTNEEATVYVKDLNFVVTVQLFEDMPPALSL